MTITDERDSQPEALTWRQSYWLASRLRERALDRDWIADLHAGGTRMERAIADLLAGDQP
jgi:hypothetical protein